MLGFVYVALAMSDQIETHGWYERQRPGLGQQFLDELDELVDEIRTRPTSFPEVEPDTRAGRLARFPYRVYFEIEPTRVKILAIYHVARDPARWDDPSAR